MAALRIHKSAATRLRQRTSPAGTLDATTARYYKRLILLHVDIPKLESRSLSRRTTELLLSLIRRHAFHDGRLPREDQLSELLGVSRTTVRAALRALEGDGVITRRRGVGTRVNAHVVHCRLSLSRVIGFADLIREAGYEPTVLKTEHRYAPAPAEAAKALGQSLATPAFTVERLFAADGVPAVHVVEVIAVSALRDRPSDFGDVSASIFEFVERHCSKPVHHTVVEVIPVIADGLQTADLSIPAGSALIRLRETHYPDDGTPIMVSFIHVDDRYIRFTFVRRNF